MRWEMNGKNLIGIFLIPWIFLAGCAGVDGVRGMGVGTPGSSQPGGQNNMTVRQETMPSVPTTSTESDKGVLSAAESAPQAGADSKIETAPGTEDALNAEETPKPVTVPDTGTAPGTEAAPGTEPGSGNEAASRTETVPGIENANGTAREEAELEENIEETKIADPIEPWNRAMFQFNDKLYFWVLKPVARGYNKVAPEPMRVSVRNFFRNVTMPIRFVNCLLQGKLAGAGIELSRFLLNSIIGLAGFFDVAKSRFKLNARNEDLGQTLGVYGMGGLMYIVWPFLGPSNVRDTVGFAGDSFLNPVNYLNPFEAAFGAQAYDRVNSTSLELGTYEDLKKSSLEPYIAVKDAYIQYRKAQIKK
jgi:phospholipid-binding lipoprotein MlaA